MDEEQEAIAEATGWTMSESAERALDAVADMFEGRFAGAFFDDRGTLVALVKQLDAAEQSQAGARLDLQQAGVRLAPARYSETDLESFAEAIPDNSDVSAVAIDVQHSRLVLHVSRTLDGSELADLLGPVPPDAVRLEVGDFRLQW